MIEGSDADATPTAQSDDQLEADEFNWYSEAAAETEEAAAEETAADETAAEATAAEDTDFDLSQPGVTTDPYGFQ